MINKKIMIPSIILGGGLLVIILVVGFFQIKPRELTIIFPEMSTSQKGFITPLITAFEIDSRFKVNYDFYDIERFNKDLKSGVASGDLYYVINNYQLQELQDQSLFSEIKIRIPSEVPPLFNKNHSYFPISWYPWGIYYQNSVFKHLGLEVPKTWDQFLILCESLLEEGYLPVSLMTKIKWPSTLWFDYLDILINGKEFHQQVLSAEIPLTDSRVQKVFAEILNLHRKGYLYLDVESFEWESMITSLKEHKAVMHLSGSFFYDNAADSLKEELGWFPFPEVETMIASSSGFVIPNSVKNKAGVKKFLKFIMGKVGQGIIEENSTLIPVNSILSEEPERVDIKTAVSSLNQYHDLMPSFERNTHPELLVPLKSFIASLYSFDTLNEMRDQLEKLEEYRKTITVELE